MLNSLKRVKILGQKNTQNETRDVVNLGKD